MNEKMKIGISSCLLGNEVRYFANLSDFFILEIPGTAFCRMLQGMFQQSEVFPTWYFPGSKT